jgi:predicted permease
MLRSSLRALTRRPAFTLTAVLTLALGIGATTAIFSVVNAVLLRPLAYPNAEELVSLKFTAPGAPELGEFNMSSTLYLTYLDEARTFENLGLWANGGYTVTGIGNAEQARTVNATHGVLPALGVQPLLGRAFAEADDSPAADGALPVILSYAYWQRRFGGAEDVLGRALTINGNPAEVIGVMPEGFRFPNTAAQFEMILPLRLRREDLFLVNFAFRGIAKLNPGVTIEDVEADVARMMPIWLDSWPAAPTGLTRDAIESWNLTPQIRPLKEEVVGSVANMLWVLMGTIGGVLLIACANVANLMLVRAEARRQEFAMRLALGAAPGRLAKELFLECLVLGVVGGALGLGLAPAGL